MYYPLLTFTELSRPLQELTNKTKREQDTKNRNCFSGPTISWTQGTISFFIDVLFLGFILQFPFIFLQSQLLGKIISAVKLKK